MTAPAEAVAPGPLLPLWAIAAIVLVLNLPFGYWRGGVKSFTLPWFVAVHAPIALVALLRIVSDVPWQPLTFFMLAGAYFAGQSLGGSMRARSEPRRAE